MAGLPLINIGANNHCSWAVTTNFMDVSDVYSETLNEAGTKYFVDGEWRDLKVVKETINIKGQEPLVLEVQLSHRGPLI